MGESEHALLIKDDDGKALDGERWDVPDQTPKRRIRQFAPDMAAIVTDYHERLDKIKDMPADEYLAQKLRDYAAKKTTPEGSAAIAKVYAEKIEAAVQGFNDIMQGQLIVNENGHLAAVAGLPGIITDIQQHLKTFSADENVQLALQAVTKALNESRLGDACREIFSPVPGEVSCHAR